MTDYRDPMQSFDESLIIKHFNKECTPEEDALLLAWMDASKENLDTYIRMKQLWALRKIDYYASDIQIRNALSKVEGKIQTNHRQKQKLRIRNLARYAAVVLLLGGILLYWLTGRQEVPELWVSVNTAGNNQVRMITLPDSTKVWLNEDTDLSYPETFAKRVVQLSGEAYFEVKQDTHRPFTVETDEMQVRVTGTSFNIRNRQTDSIVQTTLVEGVVELYHAETLLAALRPGQYAAYHRYDHNIRIHHVNTDLYTSWRNGIVMFENAYIADILSAMEDAYDVRIIYNGSKHAKRQYKFLFRKNQPVETVLEMLRFVAPINYKINRNEIYVNEN